MDTFDRGEDRVTGSGCMWIVFCILMIGFCLSYCIDEVVLLNSNSFKFQSKEGFFTFKYRF